MEQKKNNLNLIAVYAIVAYSIFAVASDLFANKLLAFGGLTLAGGVILIPFSFTIRDLMHKMIGFKNSKKVVWATAIVNLVIALLLIALDALPAAIPGVQESWHALMGASWRVILASFIAQLGADLIDTYVYEAISQKVKGKPWLRVFVSNLCSTPVDTVLFSLIAFYGILPNAVVFSTIVSMIIVKFALSLLATPLIYLSDKSK